MGTVGRMGRVGQLTCNCSLGLPTALPEGREEGFKDGGRN